MHLLGVVSLSNRYRMALSGWHLPCFAAVSREFAPFPFGEPIGNIEEPDMCAYWERIAGRVRSLEDVLKVWENQPEMWVGRSLIFELGMP